MLSVVNAVGVSSVPKTPGLVFSLIKEKGKIQEVIHWNL